MKKFSLCLLALALVALFTSESQAHYPRGGGGRVGGFRGPVIGGYHYRAPIYYAPAPAIIYTAPTLVYGAPLVGAYQAPVAAYSADSLPVVPTATIGYLNTQPAYIQQAYFQSYYGSRLGLRLHNHHFGGRRR